MFVGVFKVFLLCGVVEIVFYMYDGCFVIFCVVVEYYCDVLVDLIVGEMELLLFDFSDEEVDVFVVFLGMFCLIELLEIV